jgi:hypothetical protein
MYVLFAITVVFNIIVEVMMLILGFTDPGIIPKILPGYESR